MTDLEKVVYTALNYNLIFGKNTMTDLDKILYTALHHVGIHSKETESYKDAFQQMCNFYLQAVQGDLDSMELAMMLMKDFGVVDEDGNPFRPEKES